MELKGKIINCLGDSITVGVGATKPEENYVQILKKITKAKKVNNYGVSGTRIARKHVPSQNPESDQDFMLRCETMDKDADIVLVFGGVNDFGHGDAKMGTFESRDPYSFYGALHLLYTKLLQMYPDKTIVVLTPLHCITEATRDQNGHVLKEYVQAIRTVAEYYSLPILDLYANSGMQPNVAEINQTYFADGLHPSSFGYKRIAERIKGFLQAL